MPNAAKKVLNHTNSPVATAMERYSASTEERDTVDSFLVFQDIGESPSIIKYPVRDLHERGQAP